MSQSKYYIENSNNPGWYYAQRYTPTGRRVIFWTQNKRQALKTDNEYTYRYFVKTLKNEVITGLRSLGV